MKRISSIFFSFLLFTLGIMAAAGTVSAQSEQDSLTAKVDELFTEWNKPDSPGAAIAIIKDGSVVYKSGYGCANLEHNIPITSSTVFQIASVSKQFTAFAIAMLAQQGKLSLNDDIRKYLPEVPYFGKTITIRHLIHHISGLRDMTEFFHIAGWGNDDLVTKEHLLKMIRRQKELNFDPGKQYLYCNTGYTLLAEIVTRVMGQQFREWTKENIFKPLDMSNTHFHDNHRMIVKNRAYGYNTDESGSFIKSAPDDACVGGIGLFTTVEDLAKWIQNFFNGRVGGATVIEQMLKQGKLNSGKKVRYAFGLQIYKHKGLNSFGHNGKAPGYRSFLICFPEQKFAVVILSNFVKFNASILASQVIDIYLADQIAQQKPKPKKPERTPVKVDPAIYDAYEGKYFQPMIDLLLTITKENNRLMVGIKSEPKLELLPESETKFFTQNEPFQISFQRDEKGEVTHITLHQGNVGLRAEKIKPLSLEKLAEFEGDYYSDELGTAYKIVIQDGHLVMKHRRIDDIRLTSTISDQFVGESWWFGKIHFTRDKEKRVIGFKYTGKRGRARNLRFDKKMQ